VCSSDLKGELGGNPEVVATGGLADLMTPLCETILHNDPHLTLRGLRLAYERNRA